MVSVQPETIKNVIIQKENLPLASFIVCCQSHAKDFYWNFTRIFYNLYRVGYPIITCVLILCYPKYYYLFDIVTTQSKFQKKNKNPVKIKVSKSKKFEKVEPRRS